MTKHCKDCMYYAADLRKVNGSKKPNEWCCIRGGPINTGWCKQHNAKKTQKETK